MHRPCICNLLNLVFDLFALQSLRCVFHMCVFVIAIQTEINVFVTDSQNAEMLLTIVLHMCGDVTV